MSTPDIQMLILAWGWIPMVLFTFGYPIVARPWWRTQFGRAMEGSEISMAVLVGLSLASYWFHFILPDWAGTAILVLISTVAWMRFIALLSAQFRPPRRDDDEPA